MVALEDSAVAEQHDKAQFSVKHFQRPQQGRAGQDKKAPRESPWIHDPVHLHSSKISQSANPSEENRGPLYHHYKKIKIITLFSVLFLIELIFLSKKDVFLNIVFG